MATDVSALRIGDLASPTDFRTTRQNDDRRYPGRSAERHLGPRPSGAVTRTGEHKIGDRISSGPDDRTSGALLGAVTDGVAARVT